MDELGRGHRELDAGLASHASEDLFRRWSRGLALENVLDEGGERLPASVRSPYERPVKAIGHVPDLDRLHAITSGACEAVIGERYGCSRGPSAALGYDADGRGSHCGMRRRAHREHVTHEARVGRERGDVARGVLAALRQEHDERA